MFKINRYHVVQRSLNTDHQHPFLIYNGQRELHYELTRFGKEATVRVSHTTTKVYLYAILPWFTFLDTNKQNHILWNDAPEKVRKAIEDFLYQQMACQIRSHRQGFQLVRSTSEAPVKVRMFLVALKFFYRTMQCLGYYNHMNPLVDSLSEVITDVMYRIERQEGVPRMPSISGVEHPLYNKRSTDSYYKMQGETWMPQVIDDVTLFSQVLEGGRKLNTEREGKWGLREECVTRLLFETGGRISEVLGLTLGDWVARELGREMNAFSKGSNGRRIKFFRCQDETITLLKRYFDGERRVADPTNLTLRQYRKLSENREIDLQTVPLFLSKRGTPFSYQSYRRDYWNPACQEANINAHIHQARHWHVTMKVRYIYETSQNEAEIQRNLRELILYMKWRSPTTLEAYEHYLDAARHAEKMDDFFAYLRQSEHQQHQWHELKQGSNAEQCSFTRAKPEGLELEFMLAIADE